MRMAQDRKSLKPKARASSRKSLKNLAVVACCGALRRGGRLARLVPAAGSS